MGEIAEPDFLNEWRNQLPEQWRRFAALSELKVSQNNYQYQNLVSDFTVQVQILALLEWYGSLRN